MTTFQNLDLNATYSYADYLTWQFEEAIELIKGKIFKMSPTPSSRHQEITTLLTVEVGNFFKKKPCKVFTAPFDVRLASKNQKNEEIFSVVQPDLCVICDLNKIDAKGCIGSPDLVVEVLSLGNSKKEMSIKFDLYESAGVREYWLINPHDETVFVYFLENEKFIGKKPQLKESILQSTIFPELKIDLNEIFSQ